MKMQLLTVPAGKSRRELENSAQELRSVQLDGIIKKQRQEIDQLEQLKLNALSEVGTKNYDEVNLLTEEVLNLERRKKIALVPLEEKAKELETMKSALIEREELAAIRETDNEQTAQLLTDKLDDVSEREQAVLETQTNLEIRNSNLSLKETEFGKRQEALVEVARQIQEQKLFDDANLAKQRAVFRGREVVLEERERIVARKEKGFDDREKKVTDGYKTLQRAIAEMKLRYGDKLNL